MSVGIRRPVAVGLVSLCALAGGLVFGSAAVLAAAPEAPEVPVVQLPVGATGAMVHGVLNPAAEGHPGTYEFVYKASPGSPTECQGESRAPESPGMMLGFEREEVSQALTGLAPHTEYAICLLARNPKGEETVGPAVTFTTALALEAPATSTPATTGVTATTATLHGVLNPGAKAEAGESYEFLYRAASTTECKGEGASGGGALGEKEEAVEAAVTELLPSTTYALCLLARNEAGETAVSAPVTFTTRSAPPMVEDETVASLKSTTATLSAQINPRGLTTTYEFEYSSDGSSWLKAPEPAGSVSGQGNKAVSAEVSGLTAEAEYEYRVVATNSAGEIGEGMVERFSTQPAGIPGLPDGRVFEMVTPPENYNADVYVPFGLPSFFVGNAGEFETKLPFQVARDGEAVAFVGAPTKQGTGNSGLAKGDEYLARRSMAGGWGTPANLQPLGQEGDVINSVAYKAFSSNLAIGILQAGSYEEPSAPLVSPLAPGAGYAVLYTRSLEDETYEPFFTTRPTNRSPAEFETADVPTTSSTAPSRLAFAGASANYDQMLFEANGAFEGTGAKEGLVSENNLYESVGGRLNLINVLPSGESEANATFGGESLREPEYKPQRNPPDFSNVISEGGSRVFWTDLNTNVVYLRENAGQSESPLGPHDECLVSSDACTVQVSAGPARYWGASTDGKYTFYTEGEGEESELYRFNTERGPAGTSEVLTAPKAGVRGVVGISKDGSTVYFVSQGKLAANKNSNGTEAESGAYNLYMLKEDSQPVFVARLSGNDGFNAIAPSKPLISNTGDWQPGLGHRTAVVTPDGGSLVFMSNNQMVGDNYEIASGENLEEVYVYDADDNQLVCASCGRERGVLPQETRESERGLGAFLPISNQLTYQPTLISEDGSKVFFDSDEPLVPTDTNGEQDVYEWERDGSGSCKEGDGCVYLLSGGTGTTSSWLIGADATGSNVFMVTRAQLVPQDENENYDLYDARVAGVQPVSSPACTGTGCQGPPSSPPTFATPPSLTFNGVGNFSTQVPMKPAVKSKAKPLTRVQKLSRALKACEKDRSAKRRVVCEVRAKKRYGSVSKAKSRKGDK
jgi:hypothetical protein